MLETKVQNDEFALFAKMDENAKLPVDTQMNCVFGIIKSTVQKDTLGRDCEKYNQGMFQYKNVLRKTPLALIDDCIGAIQMQLN